MERKETFSEMMFGVIVFLAVVSLLGGVGLVGYQVYEFLRTGERLHLSVITALRYRGVAWAWSPTDWRGVYTILDACPLAVAIVGLGWLPFVLMCVFWPAEDSPRKKTP